MNRDKHVLEFPLSEVGAGHQSQALKNFESLGADEDGLNKTAVVHSVITKDHEDGYEEPTVVVTYKGDANEAQQKFIIEELNGEFIDDDLPVAGLTADHDGGGAEGPSL